MRYAILGTLGAILAAGPVNAQGDQVQRGPVPEWVKPSELLPVPEDASGLVFLRRQESLVHLGKKGQEQFLGYRARILHPNALHMGNISLTWNPAAGTPTVHTIKIYRDDRVIDVLPNASFEILRRENQLEAAVLDGQLTAVVKISDLRVGDELEVGLTTPARDPTLTDNDAGVLMLLPSPPPGRIRLGLSWDEGQKPNIRMPPDMAAIVKQHDHAVEFLFDNPPTVTAPKDAPPRFLWQRIVEFSDFADWAAISRYFSPLYTQAAKLSGKSLLKTEASQIASRHSQPLDQASAALKLVQQQVRYIYVGLDGGNLKPATAEETWQRRYGDCKGKTTLLLALLNELGIEAQAVLVSNSGADDGLDERLPNPHMFDHVLVRARIDGTDYWMDGTLPSVAPPSKTPALPYRWMLPLSEQGSSIHELEWAPAARPDELVLYEIDARAGFDQPARITSTSIIRGLKGLQQQVQLSAVPTAQLLNAFRQELIGETWQTIEDVQWRYDIKAQASILTISGVGTVDWDDDGNGARSLSLPGGGFSPPSRRVRSVDQKQDVPYYNEPEFDCRVTTVRLPTNTQDHQWSFQSGYDARLFGQNYYRIMDVRDGSIRMIRGFRVEKREIDAETAQRDNGRISSFDNSMAWIFFKPDDNNALLRSRPLVPATFDIDWLADDVPCRSAGRDR